MEKLREAYEGELHFNYKRVDKVNPEDAGYYTEENLKAFLAQKDSLDAQVRAYQMIQLKRLNGGSRTVEQAYKKLISWMDVKSATMAISKLTIASNFLPPMECEVEAKQRGRVLGAMIQIDGALRSLGGAKMYYKRSGNTNLNVPIHIIRDGSEIMHDMIKKMVFPHMLVQESPEMRGTECVNLTNLVITFE
jgi:hypothetical protein